VATQEKTKVATGLDVAMGKAHFHELLTKTPEEAAEEEAKKASEAAM
jgi:hypothetical protein